MKNRSSTKGSTMKVAINARDCVGVRRGGIGRYAINLLENLTEASLNDGMNLEVFLSDSDIKIDERVNALLKMYPEIKFHRLQYANWMSRMYFDHLGIVKEIQKTDPDILHVLKFVLPLLRSVPKVTKKVVTVHDLIFIEEPKLFPFITREYWKRAVKKTIELADSVIVPSEFTKSQVEMFYGKNLADKCRVVHHGVDPVFFRKRNGSSPGDYFLCVGTVEPRKNLKNIIKAFEIYIHKRGDRKTKIIWAGKSGWEERSVFEYMRGCALSKRIRFLHYVNDEKLSDLYRGAIALVFPSLSEGFGLPVLEAMASGCPVIHSDGGAVKEIAGECQLQVDPTAPDQIAEGMISVVEDEGSRKHMAAAGRKRARKYTWRKAARGTVEVYEELI